MKAKGFLDVLTKGHALLIDIFLWGRRDWNGQQVKRSDLWQMPRWLWIPLILPFFVLFLWLVGLLVVVAFDAR